MMASDAASFLRWNKEKDDSYKTNILFFRIISDPLLVAQKMCVFMFLEYNDNVIEDAS
jgi:hypothetical protein